MLKISTHNLINSLSIFYQNTNLSIKTSDDDDNLSLSTVITDIHFGYAVFLHAWSLPLIMLTCN